jgi:hypothetical protein
MKREASPMHRVAPLWQHANTLKRLVMRAADTLAGAITAAEILDARERANVAYVAAKTAARLAKAKDAHDEIIGACRKAMADALVIEAKAKCRLADEYDAAQERGEARKAGQPAKRIIPNENNTLHVDVDKKLMHEARVVRDAERANPGIVSKTVEEKLQAGEEPTRADVKRATRPMPGDIGPMFEPFQRADVPDNIIGTCDFCAKPNTAVELICKECRDKEGEFEIRANKLHAENIALRARIRELTAKPKPAKPERKAKR